ncbi:hypothetical protein U1Q18_026867 [Sarracenia purpurea var. burkii]
MVTRRGFGEDSEGVSGVNRGHHAVEQEEEVPRGDASPDEEVLDPSEVAHRERDLAVDRPDDARKHGCADGGHVGRLTSGAEGLIVEDDDGEEEDDKGRIESVSHPTEYSGPIEEQVFWSLLIQCWELSKWY